MLKLNVSVIVLIGLCLGSCGDQGILGRTWRIRSIESYGGSAKFIQLAAGARISVRRDALAIQTGQRPIVVAADVEDLNDEGISIRLKPKAKGSGSTLHISPSGAHRAELRWRSGGSQVVAQLEEIERETRVD
jgi:hypothetical protein